MVVPTTPLGIGMDFLKPGRHRPGERKRSREIHRQSGIEGMSERTRCDRSERSRGAGEGLCRLSSGFVPQREFYAIVYTDLVVNLTEIVPHHLVANSELVCNFATLEAKGHQLRDSKLAPAKLPSSVEISQRNSSVNSWDLVPEDPNKNDEQEDDCLDCN
jgi:hypothetical protein